MWAFGQFTLDPEHYELRCDGKDVHVEPQVFDVLRYLIEHCGEVVARESLLDAVWGDRFVSDSTLTTRIKAARQALGDTGVSQRWIRTIRQRGYQFVGPVTRVSNEDGPVMRERSPASGGPQFCRSADGVRIAYAISGQGSPLVKAANWMSHLGHDAASPVWQHWITELSVDHRLVRYDERGCGLSEWDLATVAFEEWVSDLELVAEAAGLTRFPLLGISQGAAVAIAYAARHPDRVERLVLVGGYAQGREARAVTTEERAAAALDIDLARVGWSHPDGSFRRVFASQFFPDGPPALWTAFDDLQRLTTSPENAVRFLEEFGRIDVRAAAPRVGCPTLILHSRDDRRVPFGCSRELQALIPNSRLVSLPSRNHLITAGESAWPLLLDELHGFLP